MITLSDHPPAKPNRPGDKPERPAQNLDQLLGDATEAWQQSGELSHLHGRPLDLADDTPEWLVHRFLKQAGYSHPLLEQGQELDAGRQEVDRPLTRLRRRRERLAGQVAQLTPWQIHEFNEQRRRALDEYREALTAYNRTVRDYNLSVPTALQRRLIDVAGAVAAAAEEAGPLEMPVAPRPRSTRSPWHGLWEKWRRRRRHAAPRESRDRAG